MGIKEKFIYETCRALRIKPWNIIFRPFRIIFQLNDYRNFFFIVVIYWANSSKNEYKSRGKPVMSITDQIDESLKKVTRSKCLSKLIEINHMNLVKFWNYSASKNNQTILTRNRKVAASTVTNSAIPDLRFRKFIPLILIRKYGKKKYI